METQIRRVLFCFPLILLIIFMMTGCGQIAGDPNFTLEDGETISGPLFVLSTNATLEPRSSVHGPVIMLCCNLIVAGSVRGEVFLMSGNIMLGPHADVRGGARVMSGNISRSQ